jgi:hypothetical protein
MVFNPSGIVEMMSLFNRELKLVNLGRDQSRAYTLASGREAPGLLSHGSAAHHYQPIN